MAKVENELPVHLMHGKPQKKSKGYYYVTPDGKQKYRTRKENYSRNAHPNRNGTPPPLSSLINRWRNSGWTRQHACKSKPNGSRRCTIPPTDIIIPNRRGGVLRYSFSNGRMSILTSSGMRIICASYRTRQRRKRLPNRHPTICSVVR